MILIGREAKVATLISVLERSLSNSMQQNETKESELLSHVPPYLRAYQNIAWRISLPIDQKDPGINNKQTALLDAAIFLPEL